MIDESIVRVEVTFHTTEDHLAAGNSVTVGVRKEDVGISTNQVVTNSVWNNQQEHTVAVDLPEGALNMSDLDGATVEIARGGGDERWTWTATTRCFLSNPDGARSSILVPSASRVQPANTSQVLNFTKPLVSSHRMDMYIRTSAEDHKQSKTEVHLRLMVDGKVAGEAVLGKNQEWGAGHLVYRELAFNPGISSRAIANEAAQIVVSTTHTEDQWIFDLLARGNGFEFYGENQTVRGDEITATIPIRAI
jgi:hypothetical protein